MIKVSQTIQTSDVINSLVVLSQYIKVLMVADRYSLSVLIFNTTVSGTMYIKCDPFCLHWSYSP